jgi:uncharacterized protein (TIGR03435 family)
MAVRLNFAKTLALAVGVLNAPAAGAQNASPPKFEVASIKRCTLEESPGGGPGRSGGGSAPRDPGMFRTGCVPVALLIEAAYIRYADGPHSMLKKQPLQGGPDWIDSDRYAIDAKPESPQSRAMMGGPMLQALLEDRFKLKIHRENKEVPVYALVVANGGAKIQATKEGGCTPADP